MRRPITQAQLDRVDVTEQEEADFKRWCDTLIDKLTPLTGTGPEIGVALVRAACQVGSLIGIPPADFERFAGYALDTFDARPPFVRPSDEDIEGMYKKVARVIAITTAALRHEKLAATDVMGVQLWVGVALLRYSGTPDHLVLAIVSASFADADKMSAAVVHEKGAKA